MNVASNQIQQVQAGANAQAQQVVNASVSQASQLVSGLTSKLKSAALAGTDILGAAPNIGKMIFGSVGSLFKEVNAKINTSLSNFTQDTQNIIQKNLINIPKTLNVFNSGSLSSKGLGFVASTTSKSIEGVDLPGVENFTSFANMGVGQLARLSTLGSEVLNSNKNALNAVTGNLQAANVSGSNIVNNIYTENVSISSILSPVKEITTDVASLLNPYNTANIVASNLDYLPNSLKSYISVNTGTTVANTTASALNSIGNVFGVNNLAGATQTVSNILNRYSNTYYSQASSNGGYVNGISSYTGDTASFNTLINLASSLCSSIGNSVNTIDYSTNKNLYDTLIQLACEMGLGSIANMLLNCLDTDELFDSRTKQILGDIARNSAMRGDTYSTSLSFQYANSYINNPKSVLTTLVANSEYSNINKENMNNAFSQSDYTIDELVIDQFFYNSPYTNTYKVRRNNEAEPIVYDAETVTVMQATCTDYVDEAITKEDRNLVNKVYAIWNPKKAEY